MNCTTAAGWTYSDYFNSQT